MLLLILSKLDPFSIFKRLFFQDAKKDETQKEIFNVSEPKGNENLKSKEWTIFSIKLILDQNINIIVWINLES